MRITEEFLVARNCHLLRSTDPMWPAPDRRFGEIAVAPSMP